MNLESKKVKVEKSAEYIFEALSYVGNFEKLMPGDIAKFQVLNDESFVFSLEGMPEIKLKIKEKMPSSKIILGAASDKISFTLVIDIFSTSENDSEIQLNFEGKFNPMMAMMIKGPISKFIETLANNMNKI